MKKCKITVLKRLFDEELAKEYGADGIGKCPMHEEGQTYYADFAKPENFCDEAWKAIYQYAFALAHGCELFYYKDWIKTPGVAICSCNDGIRPVIFKIERTDDEAMPLNEAEPPPLQLKDKVIALSRQGWTPDEIAKALKISKGEVELIIEISSP